MATGRNPNHFVESVKGLPINAPVVACNGNAIYDLAKDKLLWSNPMPGETVRRLIRFSIDEYPECRVLSLNGLNDNLRLELGARLNADACFDEYLGSAVYPAMELIIIQTPSITAGLREKLAKAFPELSFAQSSPEGLEINTHSGGKGNAVRILRGLLGGEQVIHTVVCAGNYENDLSMLEYADIGYAVGNAAEQVKAVADRVTVPATENAIARIIGELGGDRL